MLRRSIWNAVTRLNSNVARAGGLVASGWLLAQDHPASNASLFVARSFDGLATTAHPHQRLNFFLAISRFAERWGLEGPISNAFLLDRLCRDATRFKGKRDPIFEAALLNRMHHLTLRLDPYCADSQRLHSLYCSVASYLISALESGNLRKALNENESLRLCFFHLLLLTTCRVEWLVLFEERSMRIPPILSPKLIIDDSFTSVWGRRARRLLPGLSSNFSDAKKTDRTLPALSNHKLGSSLARDAESQLRRAWQKVRGLDGQQLILRDDFEFPAAAIAAHCRFLLSQTTTRAAHEALDPGTKRAGRKIVYTLWSWGLPVIAGIAIGSGGMIHIIRSAREEEERYTSC